MKTIAEITPKGIVISSLANKYLSIINSGTISKNDLQGLCSFFNCSKGKSTEDERRLINSTIADFPDGLRITKEQTAQGVAWLRDQWQTPKGNERQTNPFGYREQRCIETFEYFTLKELHNIGNAHFDHYTPLWSVNGKDGYFEYYMQGGICHIIG